jgi:hypothetical protein
MHAVGLARQGRKKGKGRSIVFVDIFSLSWSLIKAEP